MAAPKKPHKRQKGDSKNKQLIRDIVLRISEKLKSNDLDGIEKVVRAQFDKAMGVVVTDPENPQRIYTQEPDSNAAKVILGYAFGAIPESMKIDTEDKTIVGFLVPKFKTKEKQ